MGAMSSKGKSNMSCSTKGEPLGRRQRVEEDEQGQAERVGQHRFVLGVAPVLVADDRAGHILVEGLLASVLAGAQHVQTDPRDYGGEPRGEVRDAVGVARASRSQASWTPREIRWLIGFCRALDGRSF